MHYRQPVEAVIPGATRRVLAALVRVDTELPVSTLADIARVGRGPRVGDHRRAGRPRDHRRREVGRTVLVSLERNGAAGELIDGLAHVQTVVIARLRSLAAEIDPAP